MYALAGQNFARGSDIMEGKSDVISDKSRELTFQLLTDITNNFSEERKLGKGTFGDVYKGVFEDGQVIAVKKLRFMIEIDDKQFKNEYKLLRMLKHQNIVQLVGFCNETEKVLVPHEGRMVRAEEIHRAICLEFVPRGSLGTFLSKQPQELNWNLRFKIIRGICEGLKYLHDVPLNHLDLKPDNILLDVEMVPKIADFGISRLVGTRNTVMTLTPLGTFGYIPPEFIKKQIISREFDIFSLGVIIKKVLTVVMDDPSIAFADDQECIEHVHAYWKKRLHGMPGYYCKQVRTCIEIAVVCMDEDPRKRPTMKYIVCKLNKIEPKENDSFPPIEQFQDGASERYSSEGPSPGSNSMDWNTRFKIIKGICDGLHFIHSIPIIHMDLKPENILLDHNMVPKIAEFGMSRFFDQEQTRLNNHNVVGSNGYMAPEYLCKGEISTKSDIYGLGILIMETTTGEKNNGKNDPSGRKYIDEVRHNWTDAYIASKHSSLNANSLQRIKRCILIGLECVHLDRKMRPSIESIVDMLNGRRPIRMARSSSPLIVQPPELRFPFEPKKMISCSFSLTNTTDDHITFMLVTENTRRYLTKLPLCGVVPPNCIYTIHVTMREQKQQPSRNGEFLTLRSSKAREQQLTNAHPDSLAGDEVKEVKLPVVCDPGEGTSSNQLIQSAAEIIASHNYRQVLSAEVHPNKPWILTSNRRGNVCIWNYQTQAEVKWFEVTTEEPVYSATFIEREEWLVAGGGDGYIYVYSYDTMEEIESFKAHGGHHIRSLAASPTHSFLLSASDDHRIKIWDWKNRWECMRTFQGHGNCVIQVMFDPNESTSFVSASLDHTVKMWDIYSPTCNATLEGQPEGVLCLHYFTDQNQQFLLSGSSDGAAKIWDPEKECCVSELGGDAESLNALCWHPDLRLVITGSLDGTVQVWRSTGVAYRLENIIGFNLGAVNDIGYIKGLRRIVVGCEQGIALMEINLPQKEAILHMEDSRRVQFI